jgi:bifunctional oligoribonuclease and PAP phosphatase NrnA
MTTNPDLNRIVDAIGARPRFVVTSHVRPDGDSIGSSVAMALALRAIGKDARVVHADPAPAPFAPFPGVADIIVAPDAGDSFDAAIVMECGDLGRTGVSGLDRGFVINVDHHPGNTGYGQLCWFDPSAAACAEMVFDLIKALGAPVTREIATHIYIGILTDTGSFHYSGISPKTFAICQALLEAGVNAEAVARQVYDSNTMGRLRIFGAVLNGMQVDATGRIAVIYLDHAMVRASGGSYEDTDGLVNQPLTVKEIVAVVFFKQIEGNEYRVSMRSKGDVDVGALAKEYGGGGHKNAAGCTVGGSIDELRGIFLERIEAAIDGRSVSHR